jgi:hypothetical protein
VTVPAIFDSVPEGERIPGGCDKCDAYQVMDKSEAPFYMLRVYHDDDCPLLARMEQR